MLSKRMNPCSKHKLKQNAASSSETTTEEDDNIDRGALPDLICHDLDFMEDASTKIKQYAENVDTEVKIAREKLKELQTRDLSSEMELHELKMVVKKMMFRKIHSGNSVPHQNPWPHVNKASDEMMHNLFKEQKFEPTIDSEGDDVPEQYQRYLMCFFWFPPMAIIKKRAMIYLWMALPGIQNIGEDGMNKIFDDLVEKRFIMPVKQNSSSSPNSCMMRPSLRSFFSREILGKNWCYLDEDDEDSSNKFRAVGFYNTNFYQCLVNVNAASIDGWPEKFQKIRDLKIFYLGRWHTSPTHHIELPDTKIFNGLKNVKQLASLTFLSLQGISLITELPKFISKCTSLKILDLRACHNLEKIPDWIGKLKALTHLDMSECYFLEYMPKTLANLSNLEVLKGFVVPDVKYDKEACTLHDLSELQKLQKLNFNINAEVSPWFTARSLVEFQLLRKLTISCGGSRIEDYYLQDFFHKSFPSLQKLDLRGFPGTWLPSWVIPDKLPALETLYIRGGQLWDLHDRTYEGVKILHLKYLSELRMTWGELMFRFPNLTKLQIVECPILSNFPCDEMNKKAIDTHEDLELEWLHNVSHVWGSQFGIYSLSNLEILASVTSCVTLEYLFQLKLKMLQREDVHDVTTNKIMFPKLEYLKVENLPNLVGFYRGIDEIDFPRLKQLILIHLPQINCFFRNYSNLSSNSNLYNHGRFLSLFPQTVTFPSLVQLKLEGLHNVSHVFHSSMAGVLVNLQGLLIRDCREMEAVVGLEGEVEEGKRSKIVKTLFPQLTYLELYMLPNLRRFCHFTHSLELPLLTEIYLLWCPDMDAFSVGHVSAPKLSLPNLSWNGDLNNAIQLLQKLMFSRGGRGRGPWRIKRNFKKESIVQS